MFVFYPFDYSQSHDYGTLHLYSVSSIHLTIHVIHYRIVGFFSVRETFGIFCLPAPKTKYKFVDLYVHVFIWGGVDRSMSCDIHGGNGNKMNKSDFQPKNEIFPDPKKPAIYGNHMRLQYTHTRRR